MMALSSSSNVVADSGSISSSRPPSPIFLSEAMASLSDIVSPSSLVHRCGTILTKSGAFEILVDKAFAVCDDSGDGIVDEAELYAGLLLVHLNLAKHAGPAACFPPTREVCDRLFDAADQNNSHGLDKQQFHWVMGILCVQILSRMMAYYVVLILAVPILASYVISIAHVPEDTYLELATRESVSMLSFFFVVPLLWNAIDARYSGSGDGENPSDIATGSAATDGGSPSLLLPSKRQEQRQRRRRRKNAQLQSQEELETSI